MDYTKLAHAIIDLVESRIRELYPFIDKMASQKEGNTLLYGENYYNLENDVAESIRQIFDEDCIYYLQKDDVIEIAKQEGVQEEKITEDVLQRIKKGVEHGLDDWAVVVATALEIALEDA